MADGVFNVAKGRVAELVRRVADNDPADSGLIVVLLKANEADADLEDRADLGAILGAAGNTEADFTNYARKTLTDTDVDAPIPDYVNNRVDSDIPDQTWASAGGTTDNTLTKLLICYDPDTTGGADSAIIPLCHYDFAATTTGTDLIAQVNSAGFHRAA